MIAKVNRPSRTVILIGVVVIWGICGIAGATPIVDGRYCPAEGYSEGYWVHLTVEGGKAGDVAADDGALWLFQDPSTADLYVNFTQPLTLVDNTYGANTIGWGKGVAPSGKNHNFDDLKGSDAARFKITDGQGSVVLDFIMDYISANSKAPSGYASLGPTGGDGQMITGSAQNLLQWGTSLAYNFNTLGYVLTHNSPATDKNYTPNPSYPGWEFAVTYEFRVAGGVFGGHGFGGLEIPLVHDSPNKIAKNQVYTEINGQIPEPATIVLLGAGCIVFVRGKRGRVKQ
jgi:hypothetical protein